MAERDVNVIAVSQTIVDRIGARRSTVVANGVSASAFDPLAPLPDWFAEIRAGGPLGRNDGEPGLTPVGLLPGPGAR